MAAPLIIVVPDLLDQKGGIARISGSLVTAAAAWAAERGRRVRVHVLNDRGGRSPDVAVDYVPHAGAKASLARRVLVDALRWPRPRLVFGHVNLAPLGLVAKVRGGRYAVVVHGLEVWLPLSTARRAALRVADATWPVSRYTADDMVRRGLVERAPRVIYNCLAAGRVGADATSPPTGPPRFVTMARLSYADRKKGVDEAIAAFGLARPHMPSGTGFDIIGDGDDRRRLARFAQASGVGDAVVFHGAVDDGEADRLIAGARAFVLPSSIEGFGLVYVEAMARARAVIATLATAVPEVVVDGETGLLAGPGDVEQVAAHMISLAADHARATVMGDAGRARVAARFSYARYAEAVAAALSALDG